MILKGSFIFLGLEESPLDSSKKWARAVLVQGTKATGFYIREDELLKVVRSLPTASKITATVQINIGAQGTFCNLLSIEDVAEK